MTGSRHWLSCSGAMTLVCITWASWAASRSCTLALYSVAALWMTTSRSGRPTARDRGSAAASTQSRLDKSTRSWVTSGRGESDRDRLMIRYPCSRKRWQVASPMPRVPPVMTRPGPSCQLSWLFLPCPPLCRSPLSGPGGHLELHMMKPGLADEVLILEQHIQQPGRQLFNGDVAHRQQPGVGLQEVHDLVGVMDPVIGALLLDGQMRGAGRQQQVFIQLGAQAAQTLLDVSVAEAQPVVPHRSRKGHRDEIVVPMEPLSLRGTENGEVGSGKLDVLLAHLNGRHTWLFSHLATPERLFLPLLRPVTAGREHCNSACPGASRQTADRNQSAMDGRRIGRAEKTDDAGQVPGAHPFGGIGIGHAGAVGGGVDDAGQHGIDLDAPVSQLFREALRQPHDHALCGEIGRAHV